MRIPGQPYASVARYSGVPRVRHDVETMREVAPTIRPTVVEHDVDVISPNGARTRHPGVEVWC